MKLFFNNYKFSSLYTFLSSITIGSYTYNQYLSNNLPKLIYCDELNEKIVNENISDCIDNYDICILSTTWCGYCTRAKRYLLSRKRNLENENKDLLLKVKFIDVDTEPSNTQDIYWNQIENLTNIRAVPQIYIKQKFIGGYSNVLLWDKFNKLDDLLLGKLDLKINQNENDNNDNNNSNELKPKL